eukprot:tig00021352_g20673.t1
MYTGTSDSGELKKLALPWAINALRTASAHLKTVFFTSCMTADLALWARCPPAPKRIDSSGVVWRASLFGPARGAPKRIESSGLVRRASLFGPDALRSARPQPAGRPSASRARGSSGGPRSLGQRALAARGAPKRIESSGLVRRVFWARAPKRIESSGLVRRASLFGPDVRGAQSARARGLCSPGLRDLVQI